MNLITQIKNKYNWEFIGVWTLILSGCFGVLFLLATLLLGGCSNSSAKTAPLQAQASTGVFTLPQIPASLTDPTARANYLAVHYWDNFDFVDTTQIHLPEVAEQAFVDYIDVLPVAQPSVAVRSIESLLSATKQDETGRMYSYFLEMAEKYLYEPNSPMRNEELYLPVVEYMLSDSNLSEVEKIRPAYIREMILKNRVGTKGADFIYKLASGKTGRLYDLKTDYTLVFFNNPDCHACSEIKLAIKESPLFSELLQNGKLTILAFYSDEDISLWRKYLSEIPSSWINSYDPTGKFKDNAIYELRAIPSLYLLDKDKTVILKDADFAQLQQIIIALENAK